MQQGSPLNMPTTSDLEIRSMVKMNTVGIPLCKLIDI